MTEEDERDKFESWAALTGIANLRRTAAGDYLEPYMVWAWHSWKFRAQLDPEKPTTCHYCNTQGGHAEHCHLWEKP